MQKREDSGITHRKYHQTDKKGVANGPTSPTFSVRPMSFGRFKGEKRISSGSSSNSVFENTTQVIPSLASVKDVIDRLKKEVDSERIKRVSIAKQRSEDLLKLVLRSKNDQRPNEPKARRRLKDWHRIDFKNGCSKRSRLCNASADNLFAFISEPHLPTANSQPDIHRSFEDQSDTVQLLAGNLSGKPLDKESTVAAQEREVSLLKQQAEAEKSKNNLLVEQIRRLLEERTILVLQNTELVSRSRALQQINADQRYLDKVLSRIESIVGQAKTENLTLQSQMDRVLQSLQDITDAKRQLLLEHSALKAKLERKLAGKIYRLNADLGQIQISDSEQETFSQDLGSPNGEESVETLRAKLRELEKRCALQQLRHEEVLLELEDVRKRTRQELGTYAHSAETGVSLDSVYRSTTDLVAPYLQNTLTNNNVLPVAEGRLYSGVMETGITVSGTALSTPLSTQMQIRGRLFGNSIAAVNKYPSMPERTEGKDPNLVELFQTADGLPEKNDIPSPRMITLERQLIHSVLISWKPPDYSSTGHSVSAYHVYVDGQFRLSVKAKEKTRALIDKVDADKPHRISVRAICTKGQSKDAQCTLVVGKGMTATPGRLRATQIGTKSAKLSWIPGNSNFWHRVYLNQYEIHTCPPGVYKILLTDLTPDTLHRVCVQAVPQSAGIPEPQESPPIWINNIRSGVDTKNLAAFIEFRTLPIGLPDPPTHVQLEPGPQDDMLLVTWVPVPQDARAAADAKAAGATSTLPVQGYTVCLNDQVIEEVDGASNDHAILSLKHLKDHLERTLGLFQSPPFHGALNYPSSENYPDIPTQFYSPPADDHSQPLFITVHSTVPASSVGQGIDLVDAVSNGSRGKNFDILKGSGGPGSLPVCLTPEILVACAGSLEAAVRVFGERLSQQLGINEQSATRAGVPLRLTVEGPSSPAPTTQSDHTTGMEAGLVTVSADASARKPNPTADAIGSAEALLQRHKAEIQEQMAVNSSPEVHSLEAEPARRAHRRVPGYVRSSAPWPWPDGHPVRRLRSRIRSPCQYMQRRSLRKPWRQTRSMSDDYEPIQDSFEQAGEEYLNLGGESNESEASANEALYNSRWFRTSSLYNLNAVVPSKRWRPRGAAKSSWDLRPSGDKGEYSYVFPKPTTRGYTRKVYNRGRVGIPFDVNMPSEWISQTAPAYWPESSFEQPDQAYLKPSGYNKRVMKHAFRSPLDTPGPIMSALSSSSNEEKRYPHPDSAGRYRKETFRLPIYRSGRSPYSYHRYPRSRSSSPFRTHKRHASMQADVLLSDRTVKPFIRHNLSVGESSVQRMEDYSRPRWKGIRENDRPDARVRYRSQPSSSVMTSVPEIRVQPDPARHGPTRPSRSRYMNNYTPSEDHRRVTSQAPTGPPSNEFRQARASSPAINPMTSGSRYASVIRNPSAQTLDLTASRHPGVYSSNAVRPRPGLPVDATGEYVSSRGKTQPTQMPQSRQTQSPPQVMAQTKGFHQSVGKGLTMLPGESGPHQPVNDTRPMRMVIALYDYDPAIMSPNPDAAQEELPFREGQVIKIFGECDEDGFFWGECNGLRGLVPSNMVSKPDREPNTEPAAPRTDRQIAYDRRYANATESTALPPGQLTRPRASEQTQRPLNPPLSHYESARKFGPPSYADTRKPGPPPPNEPMVQISSAYESRLLARPSHPSEIGSSNLNVREYDDTQRPGGYSRPPTNTSSLTDYPDTGQRPHNYRRQPGTEAMSMSTPVISERISQAPIARCMVAIYDYDPQLLSPNADAEMELSFQTGDQITVYGEMDEDGFYSGELADGRRGLVPSNFLRELPGGSERQVQRSLMIRDNRNRVSQRSLEPNEKGSGNSERAQNHAKETNQQYLLSAPQAENYTEDQRLQNKPMPSTNLPRVSSNVQKDSDIPYRAGNNQDGEQRPLHYPLGRNSFQRE